MRTDTLAKDYLDRAKNRLLDAPNALHRRAYPEVVRYSQECVELSLKSILRVLGIEYPRIHDVGDVIELHSEKFPDWLKKEIPKIRRISTELALKRGPSLYGLERIGKPSTQIFDETDARDAYESAKCIYSLCLKFFKYFYRLKK